MTKIITIRVSTLYGKETYHPVCPDAKVFADLGGAPTLSANSIRLIALLGYTIDIQKEPTDIEKLLLKKMPRLQSP